jgi:nitrogenase molybdenum-iron protein alpha chain
MKDYGIIFEEKPETYYGGAGCFGDISKDFKAGCLQNAERTFTLGQQCPIATATRVVQAIQNSVLIVHSPIGCTGVMNFENGNMKIARRFLGEKEQNSWIMTTNMDENDIIMGAEEKLKKTILEAVRRHDPELISIMASCASGIIGDDVDHVIEELQPGLRAILLPIHCEGFRSRIPMTGSDSAFLGIQRHILNGVKPVKEKQDLVNVVVLPTTGPKDRAHISELIEGLGLEANLVPYFGTVAGLRRMVAAKVSTSVCAAYGKELLEFLHQEYDVPYTKFIMPIGSEETDEWLREIARHTGRERQAEEVIAREREKYLPGIQALRKKTEGKRVMICNNMMRSLSNAALSRDLGLEVVVMQMIVYNAFLDDGLSDGGFKGVINEDTQISFNGMQPYELANLLRRVNIDVYLGMGNDNARKMGVASPAFMPIAAQMCGYKGLFALASRTVDALDNNNFGRKLAAHKKLPFKDSWYNEDPFKFILTGNGRGEARAESMVREVFARGKNS